MLVDPPSTPTSSPNRGLSYADTNDENVVVILVDKRGAGICLGKLIGILAHQRFRESVKWHSNQHGFSTFTTWELLT